MIQFHGGPLRGSGKADLCWVSGSRSNTTPQAAVLLGLGAVTLMGEQRGKAEGREGGQDSWAGRRGPPMTAVQPRERGRERARSFRLNGVAVVHTEINS